MPAITNITLDTIPFWTVVAGIAGQTWETPRNFFLKEFSIPLLLNPISPSKSLSIRRLEVIYRTLVQQTVCLASEYDTEVWNVLFRDFRPNASHNTSSSHKNTQSLTEIDITRWTVEALEEQHKSYNGPKAGLNNDGYLALCSEYAKSPREVATQRAVVILSILPRVLPKSEPKWVWDIILRLTGIAANSLADYPAFKLQESDENLRLAFETIVRFYDWLFAANSTPISSTKSYDDIDAFTDIRRQRVFFENLLFPGISSPDSVIRKRAIYLLKRMVSSSSSICSIWWNPNALKSVDNTPSAMERFLLLLDTLDDHDFNILLSMWPVFDYIALVSAPDVSGDKALLNDGFLKAFFRRCLWSCDSKLLKKWILWFLFTHPTIPLVQRLIADGEFSMDLLKEIPELMGCVIENST